MATIDRILEGPNHDFDELINSRFLELSSLMRGTYHFDLQNLRQKTQTQETEISFLQAEVESLRSRNMALEANSTSIASELENLQSQNQLLTFEVCSQQYELNNQLEKTRFQEAELKSQVELVAAKECSILVLDIGLTQANQDLSELNAKYKKL